MRRALILTILLQSACSYRALRLGDGFFANRPPIATIAPAGVVEVGHGLRRYLSGRGSHDPDGVIESYLWTLPDGTTAEALDLDADDLTGDGIAPRLPIDGVGQSLVFSLTVTDDEGATGTASVTLIVVNQAPTVRLFGEEATPQVLSSTFGDPAFVLDFGTSSDPEGDAFHLELGGSLAPDTGECAATFNPWYDAARMALSLGWSDSRAPPPCASVSTQELLVTAVEETTGLRSSTMRVTLVLRGAPPQVSISSMPAPEDVAPETSVVLETTVNDPDGVTAILTWRFTAPVSAAIDCGVEWDATEGPGGTVVTLTAPATTATASECSEAVIAEVTATDESGLTGSAGLRVQRHAPAPPVHTLDLRNASVSAGETATLFFIVAPATGVPPAICTWSPPTLVSGDCALQDFGTPSDQVMPDYCSHSIPVARSAGPCRVSFTASATVAGVGRQGATILEVTNDPPAVGFVDVPEVAAGWFELLVPPGTDPNISVAMSAGANDWGAVVNYVVSGDSEELDCWLTTGCSGSWSYAAGPFPVLSPAAPVGEGTELTLAVTVDDGHSQATATLVIRGAPCLYAGGSVTSTSAPLGDLTHPYADVGEAVAAAVAGERSLVCVIEGEYHGGFSVSSFAEGRPRILGGIDAMTGLPNPAGTNATTLLVADDLDGFSFDAGASNVVEHLQFRYHPAVSTRDHAYLVAIRDAAPLFHDVTLVGGAGGTSAAVKVYAEESSARPRFDHCVLVGSDRAEAERVKALWLHGRGARVHAVVIGGEVRLGRGGEQGVGIEVLENSEVELRGATVRGCTEACGFEAITGVAVLGTQTWAASAVIHEQSRIEFMPVEWERDVARRVGVYTQLSRGVVVRDSTIQSSAADEWSAALADGWLSPQGEVNRGASVELTVERSDLSSGAGRPGCPLTLYAPAALLVGTTNAVVKDSNFRGGGVGLGGHVDDLRLPTAGPALWLVDTTDTRVEHNQLFSGETWAQSWCPAPSRLPDVVAVRDGLADVVGGILRAGSTGLVVDRNSLLCQPTVSAPISPDAVDLPCVGLDLLATQSAAVTNNEVVALAGSEGVALRLAEASSVAVGHNLLVASDPEVASPAGELTAFLAKTGVHLTRPATGSVSLINNIIWLRSRPASAFPVTALALRDQGDDQTRRPLTTFAGNLIYADGDNLAAPAAPVYVRIELLDGTALATYAANQLDTVPVTLGPGGPNVVAAPGLPPAAAPGELRPRPGSPAFDRGVAQSLTDHDIDGELRGSPPDIGADEQ
jgi:hypothetical protein